MIRTLLLWLWRAVVFCLALAGAIFLLAPVAFIGNTFGIGAMSGWGLAHGGFILFVPPFTIGLYLLISVVGRAAWRRLNAGPDLPAS
jgi:hypothetical protein